MTHIRVVSNGFGEDLISTRGIEAIGLTSATFDVYPLVGDGNAYQQLGIQPTITQPVLPSGGFLLRLRDLLADLRSGLLWQFQKQRQALATGTADVQLVVGDVFALFMAASQSDIPIVFFPTAKSERAIPHYGIELKYIRSKASLVFPRDEATHQRFLNTGIPSRYFGNPMFDAMTSNVERGLPMTIALLPGSRQEAIQNMALMLMVVSQLTLDDPWSFVFSLSPHFKHAELTTVIADLPWLLEKDAQGFYFKFSQSDICVRVSYAFFDVLQASSVVIGLAGTANEQAMHAKQGLISFIGCGPQSTKQRFQQQHQLIDGATTHFIDSNQAETIAQGVSAILNDNDFEWTPLSDHYQMAAEKIAACLRHELTL